jgi:hypothetical protein
MSDDEEVGYGKPPKHGRFKSGQSGNPKGRPKKRATPSDILQDVFFEAIEVVKDGRAQMLPRIKVLLNQIMTEALKGDQKAISNVIKLLPLLKAALAEGSESSRPDSAQERKILEEFARIAGVDPGTFFVGTFDRSGEPNDDD